MKVERVQKLKTEDFVKNFLVTKTPVIITDAMDSWSIEKFHPNSLIQEFGDELVQIYDNLFDLQNIDQLSSYLKDNFNRSDDNLSSEYVRWYTKLKDVDFFWSDEVFVALENYWAHPYFLPNSDFIIPYYPENKIANINQTSYPYKGLFISGKGAKTRLHKDPFGSNAILCQFYGQKKIILYSPNQQNILMNKGQFVDIENPDYSKFPDFDKSVCTYEDILNPGEIILFPSGWFHDVTCLNDSISITWNFVHRGEKNSLMKHLEDHADDDQIEIVKYFLKDHIPNLDANDIKKFISTC